MGIARFDTHELSSFAFSSSSHHTVIVHSGFIGPGYGVPTPEGKESVKHVISFDELKFLQQNQ